MLKLVGNLMWLKFPQAPLKEEAKYIKSCLIIEPKIDQARVFHLMSSHSWKVTFIFSFSNPIALW